MAMKININIKNLPPYAKLILSFLPAVIIAILIIVLIILPKNKEIKTLENKISTQEAEIAKSQAKSEKLTELTLENERLKKRLEELKQQLPEEREISGLLKEVSDLGIKSGLQISLWKPEQKKTHSSGIVYEIPVKVELTGSYHSLGYFFSSLAKLNRIVNLSDIKLGDPKPGKDSATLKISFTATTFSAIPEEEMAKEPSKPSAGKKT
jgi:type IV pilus assembly protein PilO